MSGILPLIRNTATALYPLTRSVEFDTSVSIAINGNEQRYKRRQVLMRATLNYVNLSATDRGNLRTFFNSQKGEFDPTWYFVLGKSAIGGVSGTTLTIPSSGAYFFTPADVGGTAYIANAAGGGNPLIAAITGYISSTQVTLATSGSASGQDTRWGIYFGNMTLTADMLSMLENQQPLHYSLTLPCRQTQQLVSVAPTALAAYPTLSAGLVAQHPYTQIERFYTMVADQASGMRHSYEYYGSGLAGFPTGALLGWKLEYPALSNTDLTTVENFFRGQFGRYGAFSFTDPDSGTLYSPCRFDQDILEVVHQSPNLNTVTVQIVQTNN